MNWETTLLKKIILLIVISIGLIACNRNKSDKQEKETSPAKEEIPLQTQEFTIKVIGNTMESIHYSVKELRMAPGAKIKIILINESKDSTMKHNIVIVDIGTIQVNAAAAMLAGPKNNYIPNTPTVIAASTLCNPGQTIIFEFTAPKAGTYEYFCSYPGHWQKMNGKLIVG